MVHLAGCQPDRAGIELFPLRGTRPVTILAFADVVSGPVNRS